MLIVIDIEDKENIYRDTENINCDHKFRENQENPTI